jgi:hypothetical protein
LAYIGVLFGLRALTARNAVPQSRTSVEFRPATRRLHFRIACPLRLVIVEQIKPAIVYNTMLSRCGWSIARYGELFNYLEV